MLPLTVVTSFSVRSEFKQGMEEQGVPQLASAMLTRGFSPSSYGAAMAGRPPWEEDSRSLGCSSHADVGGRGRRKESGADVPAGAGLSWHHPPAYPESKKTKGKQQPLL